MSIKARYFICLILLLIPSIICIILGPNVISIPVLDNLDSNVVWIKLYLENQNSMSNGFIDNMMYAMSKGSFIGFFNHSLLIFDFFGIFKGYFILKAISAIIGFIGMLLLLKTLKFNDTLCLVIAVLFGLLPTWSFLPHSSSIPLFIYVVYNIYQERKLSINNILILIVLAFTTSLVLIGVNTCLIILGLLVYNLINNKKIHFPLLIGLCILSISYLISHFPTIKSFFNDTTNSIRSTFNYSKTYSESFVAWFLKLVYKNHWHAPSAHFVILIIAGGLIVFSQEFRRKRQVLILISLIILNCLIGSLFFIESFADFSNGIYQFIPIDLTRTYFFNPALWYILLAYIVNHFLMKENESSKLFAGLTVIICFLFIVLSNEQIESRSIPTYAQFNDQKLHDNILDVIPDNLNSTRFASFGLDPSVLLFGGFKTIDGYYSAYEQQYKDEFYQIIKDELNKDQKLHDQFFYWGAKAYLWSPQSNLLDFEVNDSIYKLDFDLRALNDVGCDYLVSNQPIQFIQDSPMDRYLIDRVKGNYWDIWLYHINEIQ